MMKSVEPERHQNETFSRHNVVELLAVDPQFDWAKDVPFRRPIWTLEFKFKPMRMVYVDIPQESGQMRQKLIWYMVYSVTNSGKVMRPAKTAEGTFEVQQVTEPIKDFIPEFLLEAHEFGKAYPDRVIPLAIAKIQLRERIPRLFSPVDMAMKEIGVGETVWGVATWENIDPQIDRFSVYIKGLTNAYRWKDEPGAYKVGDRFAKGRTLAVKTLKLNFWRPGDEYYENEREFRYGIPGEVDYEWVYR